MFTVYVLSLLFFSVTLDSRLFFLSVFLGWLQMQVQPVTAAGPDHSKSIEKPELYPSLFQGQDQTKGLPSSTPTPSTQIYAPNNNFAAGRSSDAYR